MNKANQSTNISLPYTFYNASQKEYKEKKMVNEKHLNNSKFYKMTH